MKAPKCEIIIPKGFFQLHGRTLIQAGDYFLDAEFVTPKWVRVSKVSDGIGASACCMNMVIRHKSKG